MGSIGRGNDFNAVTELLGTHPQERGDKTAIYCGTSQVTYKDLELNINRFANILKTMGIHPSDRVLIVMPDSPMFVYAFLGSIKYGAWPVPVNTMLGEEDYRYLLNDSAARVLVTPQDGKAAEIETEHLQYRIFPDNEFESLFASVSPDASPHLANREDIAFWLYSSGSTGKPKATPHKHLSMIYTADTYARNILKLSDKDVCFSVSKLFFAYGLGNSISFPLRVGASCVLLSEIPTRELILETLQNFQPTVFFGVPTQYNSLLKGMESLKLQSLRLCVSAGEALPPEIQRQWKKLTGFDIIDGIGSTEALHIFISNRPDDIKEGTSGRLVPGYEAKIVDDEGSEVPAGQTGHLLIRGAGLTPGYWNNPIENELKILVGGWFRTGDMYSVQDGYYTYQGRGDDMLKAGGIWVSPMEIEYALIEHNAVNECAVVGHKVSGLEKPFAYVVLNKAYSSVPKETTAKELMEFLTRKLPKFKLPWGIRFVADLPKTSTGKIQRFKLRQRTL